MKKNQKEMKEFQLYKSQLTNIRGIVSNTKADHLWSHEAAVRKKLKALAEMKKETIKGFSSLYQEYRALLDDISKRLLEDYNQKNKTQYVFEEVIKEYTKEYIRSGIMNVLITSHIPKTVAEEFERYFPDNPKDEYVEARKMKRTIYLHLGETNTGKTYYAIERLKECQNGIYLAPLRILALEIYERLNESGVPCNLMTGEEQIIVERAVCQSATIEKLNLEKEYEIAVIDEIQMMGDRQRGAAWTRALLGLRCKEIHVCGASLTKELLQEIVEDCNDLYERKEYVRNVPLQIQEGSYQLQEAEHGDALIVFAKKRVLELAKWFKSQGISTSMIYGDLPPEVRKLQYHDFIEGNSKILVSTDAIGMGVNLPIRRIIFINTKKFDGSEVRPLTSQEVKQIAGRAGRKGIYEIGYVAATGAQADWVKEKIEMEDDPLEEAVVGPSEALLKIKGMPLREKLALWSAQEEKVPIYRKMDTQDAIFILDKIRSYKLQEEVEWRLIRLPFDVHNERIFEAFREYVEQYFVRKKGAIQKPDEEGRDLDSLEVYYQKLNLYYSFSRSFGIAFEEKWVYEERARVSERINELLVKGWFG